MLYASVSRIISSSGSRTRTCNLCVNGTALYQLSYPRIKHAPGRTRTCTLLRDLIYSQGGQPIAQPTLKR